MAFTEDLDIFFGEFGVAATLKTAAGTTLRTLSVIFDAPGVAASLYDAQVETESPTALAQTAAVEGATHGHTLTIAGVVYRIREIRPDGTGLTRLILK
jgi:hypothetical protein